MVYYFINKGVNLTGKSSMHIDDAKNDESINLRPEYILGNLANFEEELYQIVDENRINKNVYPNFYSIYDRYGGACCLITNYFTLNSVETINPNYLDIDKLEQLAKTHLLSLVSWEDLRLFVLKNKIPHSIFTESEQYLIKTKQQGIDDELLSRKLLGLSNGTRLNFSIFNYILPLIWILRLIRLDKHFQKMACLI